jgi:DNA repair exonuclease SbcCD ATPase subunit
LYIKSITLRNFTGIRAGLGLYEITIDFPNPRKQASRMVLLCGKNGSGKSTLISNLHPFAKMYDGRDSEMIIPGTDGLKKLTIVRGKTVYKIEHHYLKSKGTPKTKSFLWRNDEDLNPSGSVTEFNKAIATEFGLTDDYFNVGRIATKNDNFLDLLASKRKEFIAGLLPDISPYSRGLLAARQHCAQSANNIKFLADEMGKLRKQEEIESDLIEARGSLKAEERTLAGINKDIGKLEQAIETIEAKDHFSNASEMNEELEDLILEVDALEKAQEKLTNTIHEVVDEDTPIDSDMITEIDEHLEKRSGKLTIAREKLRSRNSEAERISESIAQSKESLAKIKEEKSSKEEIEALVGRKQRDLRVAEDRYGKAELKALKMLDLDGTDSLPRHLIMARPADASRLEAVEKSLCSAAGNAITTLAEGWEELLPTKEIQSLITARRATLSASEEVLQKAKDRLDSLEMKASLADDLTKRPANCKIDTCGFLKPGLSALQIRNDEVPKAKKEYDKAVAQALVDRTALNQAQGVAEALNELHIFSKQCKIAENVGEDSVLGTYIEALAGQGLHLDNIQQLLVDIDEMGTENLAEIASIRWLEELMESKEVFTNLEAEVKTLEERAETITKFGAAREEMRANITSLEESLVKIKEEIVDLRDSIPDLEDKLTDIKDLRSSVIKFLDGSRQLAEKTKKLDSARKIVKDAEKDLKDHAKLTAEKVAKRAERKEHSASVDKSRERLERLGLEATRRSEYQAREAELTAVHDLQGAVRDACDPKMGVPLRFLRRFLEGTQEIANRLFDIAFGGRFRISFDINEKEFNVIVHKESGETLSDVKLASEGETALIKTIVSLSILSQYVEKFPILCLDEVDAVLDSEHRTNFATIVQGQIEEMGLDQVFIISHNEEFRDPTIGRILFPGHHASDAEGPLIADFCSR